MTNLYALMRPAVHLLPPETAHGLAIATLRSGVLLPRAQKSLQILHTHAFGHSFSSPVGLAAGFDKNAEVIDAMLRQGFSFVEAGTVTPKSQPGNDKPRIFRLSEDRAVINRLGFNNKGLEYFCKQFATRDCRLGIAGANIGKNKDSEDAIADYTIGLRGVYPLADYVTINISSPNTQGLRDLQQRDALEQLLKALHATRGECIQQHHKTLPMLLKIAPDIDEQQAEDIAEIVLRYRMDGLIVSNTTLARPESLRSVHKGEQGGLSGLPLFDPSTRLLRQMYRLTGGKIPLVGVGGVGCARTAYEKIKAGATLVQLYTALVYEGVGLACKIQKGLAELLERDGFSAVQEAVGVAHR
ncbi:MAG: quinone-dependent dihydroorotate dehydrogenase [Alphaproteobacteria bacterium]